ncbi:MAG: AF1514 family protein [Desulfobacterales bacterium]
MDYLGRLVKITTDSADLDFLEAKDIAKRTAREHSGDPMLLSWYQSKTGEGYPNLECGKSDKPAWIVYAESRGGDLTIDINAGEYVFVFLSLDFAKK